MDTEAARRYARQIALSDVGPDGQERICRARVAVVGEDLSAETAALYLEAAGVGSVIRLGAADRDGAGWMAALTEIDLVVRAGFDDDAMAGAAARLGIPVVVMRALPDRVDLVSFPRRAPAADAALEVPAQTAAPSLRRCRSGGGRHACGRRSPGLARQPGGSRRRRPPSAISSRRPRPHGPDDRGVINREP